MDIWSTFSALEPWMVPIALALIAVGVIIPFRAILAITPAAVEGLSILSVLIQGRDFCCPQTVGMWKGTGALAHPQTR